MSILVNMPAREKPTIIPACAVHAVTPERLKLVIGTLNQVIVSNVCRSDSRYGHRKHMKGLTFMPFLAPGTSSSHKITDGLA